MTTDVTGMSLIGNYLALPLGDFSTVYQAQDRLSRTIGRHTLKFGVEFRRLQLNGTLDFGANGLYSFEDLTPFGLPASSNNPALEFFLKGLPLSYVGVNPSNANSDRGYRESIASSFVQDFVRVNSRLTLNVGLRYDFYSNPTEAFGRESAFPNPATDSAPVVGKLFASTPLDLFRPRQAWHGTSSATAKLWCGADSASIAINSRHSSSASSGFYRLSSVWRNSFFRSF